MPKSDKWTLKRVIKKAADVDLNTAIAMSKSIQDEIKIKKKRNRKKEKPIPLHLMKEPSVVSDIISKRLGNVIIQDFSIKIPSITSKVPTKIWDKTSLYNDIGPGDLSFGNINETERMEFYVTALMPPISTTHVRMGDKIISMSKIPGRERSFLLSPKLISQNKETSPIEDNNRFLSPSLYENIKTPENKINVQNDIEIVRNNESFLSLNISESEFQKLPNDINETVAQETSRFYKMFNNSKSSDMFILLKSGDIIYLHKFIFIAWDCKEDCIKDSQWFISNIEDDVVIRIFKHLYSDGKENIDDLIDSGPCNLLCEMFGVDKSLLVRQNRSNINNCAVTKCDSPDTVVSLNYSLPNFTEFDDEKPTTELPNETESPRQTNSRISPNRTSFEDNVEILPNICIKYHTLSTDLEYKDNSTVDKEFPVLEISNSITTSKFHSSSNVENIENSSSKLEESSLKIGVSSSKFGNSSSKLEESSSKIGVSSSKFGNSSSQFNILNCSQRSEDLFDSLNDISFSSLSNNSETESVQLVNLTDRAAPPSYRSLEQISESVGNPTHNISDTNESQSPPKCAENDMKLDNSNLKLKKSNSIPDLNKPATNNNSLSNLSRQTTPPSFAKYNLKMVSTPLPLSQRIGIEVKEDIMIDLTDSIKENIATIEKPVVKKSLSKRKSKDGVINSESTKSLEDEKVTRAPLKRKSKEVSKEEVKSITRKRRSEKSPKAVVSKLNCIEEVLKTTIDTEESNTILNNDTSNLADLNKSIMICDPDEVISESNKPVISGYETPPPSINKPNSMVYSTPLPLFQRIGISIKENEIIDLTETNNKTIQSIEKPKVKKAYSKRKSKDEMEIQETVEKTEPKIKKTNTKRKSKNESDIISSAKKPKTVKRLSKESQLIEDILKTPPNSSKPNSFNPFTPMPPYDSMTTPEINRESKKFNLKPRFTKKYKIALLKKFHEQSHQIDNGKSSSDDEHDEPAVPFTQSSNKNNSNEPIALNDNAELYLFLKANYFRDILTFKPIFIDKLLEELALNGIKLNMKDLKNYLDYQCINYDETLPENKNGNFPRPTKKMVL